MAKLIFGMNVSLDGYVDHERLPVPDPTLFAHWTEMVRNASGSVYGRVIYQLMQYWDEDQPDWGEAEHAFAAAWRRMPKWVASTTLSDVGPNTTLIQGDVGAYASQLKSKFDGEIHISGPVLAGSLSHLIDEYRLYLHPSVLGNGNPFFHRSLSQLRLVASDCIGDTVIRLTYQPD